MQAKLIITDDKGEEVVVSTDLGQIGALEHMDCIENFVVAVKHRLMPQLEQVLLEKIDLKECQQALVKKKMVLKALEFIV